MGVGNTVLYSLNCFAFTLHVEDKDFGKQALRKEHVNPPAEVSTSLKTYQHFSLEKAYLREDFFWAFTPTAGDFIRFRFFKPLRIERWVYGDLWRKISLTFKSHSSPLPCGRTRVHLKGRLHLIHSSPCFSHIRPLAFSSACTALQIVN